MAKNREMGLKADWTKSIRLMQKLAMERNGKLEVPCGRLTGFSQHTPVLDEDDFARLCALIGMYKDRQVQAMARSFGKVTLA